MKQYVAFLILILGTILAIFTGLFVFFIGGVSQLVTALFSQPINSLDFAIGFTRALIAYPVGWGIFLVSLSISIAVENDKT